MEPSGDEVIVLIEWRADLPAASEQAAAEIERTQLQRIVQRVDEEPGAFMIRALEQIERREAKRGEVAAGDHCHQ